MSQIKFGTDGWRAIIAREFTFETCAAVAQGIANYVNCQNLKKKGIIIGYDNRFLSRDFARECARVLVGNGISVFLFRKVSPTPLTAFAIRRLEAGGAIMLTASHNPPEYNGIKFITEYACPALPEVTEEIESKINRVLAGGKVYELNLDEAEQLGLFEEIDLEREYINHLMSIINRDCFKNGKIKVVVDPMFGAGVGYLDRILAELGCEVRAINNFRDTLFGGTMPEPTDKNLSDLKRAVLSYNADIGLAMDGDADRFGIIDENGEFVTANCFLSLLLNHLLKTRSFRGPVCRSLATTHMLDRIAHKNGLSIIETPVGFKYIGEALREKGCILGGEESGGLSILGHVPEKDGILACLLAVEILAYSGKSITELIQELKELYGTIVSERLDIPIKDKDIEKKIKAYKPKDINGIKVESVIDTEGRKILLGDESWILMRVSGTEPVVRLYIEANSREQLENMKFEVRQALGI